MLKKKRVFLFSLMICGKQQSFMKWIQLLIFSFKIKLKNPFCKLYLLVWHVKPPKWLAICACECVCVCVCTLSYARLCVFETKSCWAHRWEGWRWLRWYYIVIGLARTALITKSGKHAMTSYSSYTHIYANKCQPTATHHVNFIYVPWSCAVYTDRCLPDWASFYSNRAFFTQSGNTADR